MTDLPPVRTLGVVLLAFLAAGCMHPRYAFDYGAQLARDLRVVDNHDIGRHHRFVLPARSAIYVAETLPAIREMPQAGLVRHVYPAFAQTFPLVSAGTRAEPFSHALRNAREAGCDYVVYPQLVVRDDDLGTWNELQDWLKKRDLSIQDPLPDPAAVTERLRLEQERKKAEADARIRRDNYYRWREAQEPSRVESLKLKYRNAQEHADDLQVRMLQMTEDGAQWTHEQIRAFVLWVRSREYDRLGRDQVGVRVILADAETGTIVESALVSGQSGVLTFLGDTPEGLVDASMLAFARSLSNRENLEHYQLNRFAAF